MASVNEIMDFDQRRIIDDVNGLANYSAIYTPLGGDATTIRVIARWGEGGRNSRSEDGVMFSADIEIEVHEDDCPDRQPGDQFRIEGVDYRVTHIPRHKQGSIATVFAEDVRHLEKSDGGIQRTGR
jgi:hypothetical protein